MQKRTIQIIILVLFFTTTSSAYVIQQYRNSIGDILFLQWSALYAQVGIRLHLNKSSFPFSQSETQRVFEQSIAAWNGVSTADATLNDVPATFLPTSGDSRNVIYYDATGDFLNLPPNTGVIALTRLKWTALGVLTDADIIFNGRDLDFTTNANQVSPTRLDLQDVLTHELGHLLGLDHSPLRGAPTVRPTMTPFYMTQTPGERRTLEPDDRAGLTANYPLERSTPTGTITGQVRQANGEGIFGVHVVAYQANTQNFVASVFSDTDPQFPKQFGSGNYRLEGLPPGTYQLAIEPINNWVTYRNFTGIFNAPLPTNITPEFYPNRAQQQDAPILQVSAGQTVPHIDFVLGIGQPDTNMVTNLQPFFNSPDITGPHTLSVNISSQGGVRKASLLYQLNQDPHQVLPLQKSHEKYSAELPHQPQGTQISYRILAQAYNGTETVYPTWDQPALTFEVVEELGDWLFVALNRSGEVGILNASTQNITKHLSTGDVPTSVVLAPKLKRVFVTHALQTGGRITSIDLITQQILTHIDVGATPLDLVLSPNEENLYVTNATGRSVSVINPETLHQRWQLPVRTAGEGPFGIVISPDGKTLYLTDPGGSQVLIIDADRGTEHHRIPTVPLPRSLALSPNGEHLYVAGFEGGITLINTQTGTVTRTIDTTPALGIYRILINPNGTHAFLTDSIDDNLLVLDLEAERITHVLDCHRNPRDLALSPDGNTLYVANQDANTLLVFDTQNFSVQDTLTLADGPRGIVVWNALTPSTTQPISQTDLDSNGITNFADFLIFIEILKDISSGRIYQHPIDFNQDGKVNFQDFLILADAFGT